MSNELIYVADDEERIRDLICSYLENEGYRVKAFSDGTSILEAFYREPANMLILDIMMPGLDGYSVCREIRKTTEVPVIMVSAKDDEIDRILGLELGSDDYVSKPFSPRELVIRVKKLLKRAAPSEVVTPIKVTGQSTSLKCRDIELIPEERRVSTVGISDAVVSVGKNIDLTTKEFDLLQFLVINKNHAYTREQLIERIWGYDYIGETRTIDDLVKRIRKKLIEAESKTEISTVWGFGYKVVE